jgi:hypothetical protein
LAAAKNSLVVSRTDDEETPDSMALDVVGEYITQQRAPDGRCLFDGGTIIVQQFKDVRKTVAARKDEAMYAVRLKVSKRAF